MPTSRLGLPPNEWSVSPPSPTTGWSGDQEDVALLAGQDAGGVDAAGMPFPPADSPLRHFAEPAPPSSTAWVWAIGQPETAGRLRLPAPAKYTLGLGPSQPGHVRGLCHNAGLVLHATETTGARLRVDSAGRLTLPMWLRDRGPLAIGTNHAAGVVVIAPTAVLDPVGELLARTRR